jgi:outer membrane protein assembly factor BamA
VAGGPASSPTGLPLGGNALFYNNVEVRFPLIGQNIGGVLFHDMGNVFSSLGKMSLSYHQANQQDFNYTAQAVGFGIRYKTPFGPLRLDLAYSLNPPTFVGFKGTAQQLLTCNPSQMYTSGPCVGVPQTLTHFQFFFSIGQMF